MVVSGGRVFLLFSFFPETFLLCFSHITIYHITPYPTGKSHPNVHDLTYIQGTCIGNTVYTWWNGDGRVCLETDRIGEETQGPETGRARKKRTSPWVTGMGLPARGLQAASCKPALPGRGDCLSERALVSSRIVPIGTWCFSAPAGAHTVTERLWMNLEGGKGA